MIRAKGAPTPKQLESINPLLKPDSIDGYGTKPKLIQSVLSEDTPPEVIDLIERLLDYEP